MRLHPANPHYFDFRGKPTVLIGSSEHYAAVSNTAFDYERYLDATHAAGLNVVRIFTGTYSETLDSSLWHMSGNTLAHVANHYLAPWPRTEQPGAADGGLLEIQDALVRKLVGELHAFDNVYFELCNEPFAFLGVSPQWQAHVAQVLEDAERRAGSSHLIAQELDISPPANASELRCPLV